MNRLIEHQGKLFEVNLDMMIGNIRGFQVPAVPMEGFVVRDRRNDGPLVRYNVFAEGNDVETAPQELCSSEGFDQALDDYNMLGHVSFIMGLWTNQKQIILEARQAGLLVNK